MPAPTPEQRDAFELENVHRYYEIARRCPHLLPHRSLDFASLDDLMRRVHNSGNRFFMSGSVRFFAPLAPKNAAPGVRIRFFITSMTSPHDQHERAYQVRYVCPQPGLPRLEVCTLRPVLDTLPTARLLAAEAKWACQGNRLRPAIPRQRREG